MLASCPQTSQPSCTISQINIICLSITLLVLLFHGSTKWPKILCCSNHVSSGHWELFRLVLGSFWHALLLKEQCATKHFFDTKRYSKISDVLFALFLKSCQICFEVILILIGMKRLSQREVMKCPDFLTQWNCEIWWLFKALAFCDDLLCSHSSLMYLHQIQQKGI